tara:strand:+ start:5845 stop:6048 length:204 start_codon:yes stop_codon:yes gene_type:complete
MKEFSKNMFLRDYVFYRLNALFIDVIKNNIYKNLHKRFFIYIFETLLMHKNNFLVLVLTIIILKTSS